MAFGNSLKKERERKNMTQGQFAELIGVTQGAISQYENCVTSPTAALAVKIAKALGTTVEEMVEEKS